MKTFTLRLTIVQRLSILLFGMTLVFGAIVAAAAVQVYKQAAQSADALALRVATNHASQLRFLGSLAAARGAAVDPLHLANRRLLEALVHQLHQRDSGEIRIVDSSRIIIASSVPGKVNRAFESDREDIVAAALGSGSVRRVDASRARPPERRPAGGRADLGI